jgi:hypothetical protein
MLLPRRKLPLGAGAFGFLLVQPSEELWVSQEFLHPGFDVGVEVLVFPVSPEGVLFHGVSCRARRAPQWGVALGVVSGVAKKVFFQGIF